MSPVRMAEQALTAVLAHKTRSFLMMLGVIIGVATLTIIASSVLGARAEVLARVEKFGLNRIGIIAGAGRKPGVPQPACTSLKAEDAQAILAEIPNVKEVCGEILRTDCPVKCGNKNTYVEIIMTDPSWASVWDLQVPEGRFYTEEDNLNMARVAVVGPTVKRDIFEGENPIGKLIMVGYNPFVVIGVLESRGTSPRGDDMDNQIVIPLRTGQKRVLRQDHLFAMKVGLRDPSRMSETVADIRELLRQRHHLKRGIEDDFTIISPTQIMIMMSSVSSTFSLFLILVSGISLLVGAIVIANIMFIAVNERRSEIGIRRAVGARKRDILGQFLLEAVGVATAGGMLGIVLGVVGQQVLSRFTKLPSAIMWEPCAIALLSAILVGLGAGIHPARQAANSRPIDALK
jgi:putative ABC transport system permease protein